MFMGLSLMPEYYKEKVNLFVAMAPAVFIRGVDEKTKKEAAHWKLIEEVMEKIKWYNFIAFRPEYHEYLVDFCNLLPSVCSHLADIDFILPEVDNMSRGDVMYSAFPSGAGYRTTVYYGQCVANGGNFRRYDYGHSANKAIYG